VSAFFGGFRHIYAARQLLQRLSDDYAIGMNDRINFPFSSAIALI